MSIPDPDFLPIPDPGVKKASDPGSGSATLLSGSVSVLPLNPDANPQHWCLSCAFLGAISTNKLQESFHRDFVPRF
jgi:hypothetical protein